MYSTHRKHPSRTRLNDSSIIQESAPNQSFTESAVGKRFTRKKESTEDTTRSQRLSRGSDSIKEEPERTRKEGGRTVQMAKFVYKPEDLFLQFSETPSKNSHQRVTPSSDRTTEVSFLPDSQERQSSFLGLQEGLSRGFLTEFREEMDLKNGEVMLLEDEVQRLRKTIVGKEEEYQKEMKRREKEVEEEVKGLKDEIKELKSSLQEKNMAIKEQKKTETNLLREIKSLKYEKLMLEKQLEDLYKKKLPKDLKEVMSYRQISLMAQLEQLKQQIDLSKTEHELLLEQQILRLKQHNTATAASLNTLTAHSHILNRKLSEKQAHMREKAESFGRHYSALKENHSVLLMQLKETKKENLKLRRQQGTKTEKMRKMAHSSSEESLTFSLSSNN